MFTVLNNYRNKTKAKQIPIPIIAAVHSFLGTFIVNAGPEKLLGFCNSI